MKLVVLIASHINQPERIETLKYALKSLYENTEKPDFVGISCSYDPKLKPDITIWERELKEIPNKILLRDRKLHQFEHYKLLTSEVEKTDIICFLDDDDLYDANKISLVKSYFKEHTDVNIIQHPHYKFGMNNPVLTVRDVFDIDFKDKIQFSFGEYWSLCMRGHLYIDWFLNTPKYINMTFEECINKFAGLTDLLFSASFKPIEFTKKPLMYQRIEKMKKAYTR